MSGRTTRRSRKPGKLPDHAGAERISEHIENQGQKIRGDSMWAVFALLSAVFAALTSILAKVGIDGVNSNLATAIRTVVVLAMAWGMVFLTNAQRGDTGNQQKKAGCF